MEALVPPAPYHHKAISDHWTVCVIGMIYDEVQDPVPTILSQWTANH